MIPHFTSKFIDRAPHFVPVPRFSVINDFAASEECVGVFLNRAGQQIPWDTPPPTTQDHPIIGPADPGMSRLFLYDPVGQWVNLSDCEDYTDVCDFYHCFSYETAQSMLDRWLYKDESHPWRWKKIPDEGLSLYLGVTADWTDCYRGPGKEEDDEEDELGVAVFRVLDQETKDGHDMFLWPDEAVAEDIRDLDEGIQNWDRGDIVPYVIAWREKNSPRKNKSVTISQSFEIYEIANSPALKMYDAKEIEFIDLINSTIDGDCNILGNVYFTPEDYSRRTITINDKICPIGPHLLGLHESGVGLAFCLVPDMGSEVNQELSKSDWNILYMMYVRDHHENCTLFLLSK